MKKNLTVLRIIGNRIAIIPRYSDKGFYIAVDLNEKLAEGRKVKVNKFSTSSDFYYGIVENQKFIRKVKDYNNLINEPAQLTDLFTVEIFNNRRMKYVKLKNRLIEAIKKKELKGVANRAFNNLKNGYLPKTGFLRFSKKMRSFSHFSDWLIG